MIKTHINNLKDYLILSFDLLRKDIKNEKRKKSNTI